MERGDDVWTGVERGGRGDGSGPVSMLMMIPPWLSLSSGFEAGRDVSSQARKTERGGEEEEGFISARVV